MKTIFPVIVSLSISLAATAYAHAESLAYNGTFHGLSNHVTTGNVSIFKAENGGSILLLGKDFSLDGAPDPSVGLGKDGKYDSKTNLGNMTKINGRQVYIIPDDLDWSAYNEVYIWCAKFTVPLGVAPLK